MRPTPVAVLVVAVALGLLLGSLVRPLVERAGGVAPVVPWVSVVTLLFLAAALGLLAWDTHRTVQVRRDRVEPANAVTRLLLAKACAVAGALTAGGYLGYAVSFLADLDAVLPRERVVRSGVAVLSAGALVVAALLLERACRVPGDPDDDHRPGTAA